MNQFTSEFAKHWDELIDWEKRIESENNFLIDLLKRYGVRAVLDAATGTGFDSVQLAKAGFNVMSIDESENMLNQALINASRYGVTLNTQQCCWGKSKIRKKFDAVVCLGNSLACATDEKVRSDAASEWGNLLNPGGIIVVDHRNYDSMIKNGLQKSKKFYYLSHNVIINPKEISVEMTKFNYKFGDGTDYDLDMYPLSMIEIKELFIKKGLKLKESYGDRISGAENDDVSFYLHVFEKVN